MLFVSGQSPETQKLNREQPRVQDTNMQIRGACGRGTCRDNFCRFFAITVGRRSTTTSSGWRYRDRAQARSWRLYLVLSGTGN